nr:putative integron gene cassette protein [uncultured bacterium]
MAEMKTHDLSEQDLAFRAAFETFLIDPAGFDHRAHVRLAYAYLAGSKVELACLEMRGSLLAFLNHNNVPASKFHETLTRAWIFAVHHFMG